MANTRHIRATFEDALFDGLREVADCQVPSQQTASLLGTARTSSDITDIGLEEEMLPFPDESGRGDVVMRVIAAGRGDPVLMVVILAIAAKLVLVYSLLVGFDKIFNRIDIKNYICFGCLVLLPTGSIYIPTFPFPNFYLCPVKNFPVCGPKDVTVSKS